MIPNAAARARAILDERPLFFDTETTGLNSSAEIVEVGIVDAEGNTLLESLVRPIRRIPSDAVAVHGISNAMVRNAPTW
ncbi:MAG: 3'-5' exonuclease, partial [Caldilineaceae bacterium]|nr:3'-5' exonuclease [Caldilineaceae bacterium]